MIIVKFIVAFIFISVFRACQTNYCEICSNHTLCTYTIPGPGPKCQSYDSTALLTGYNITELVNKINQRRNFVAMGFSKFVPQAANMKKIHWSPELASFAQRWVDQCDQTIRPDKEDQCRDLANTKVSQNIASIVGPSPGLNVKSFVETWFIQILDYTGSVTYYNQSNSLSTNYFTQLIWADTEFVGCGKAKFYVDEQDTMIERLVCNFAPKGNTHGRPVYTLGYPATQCPDNMIPDRHFKGLCNHQDQKPLRELQTQRPMSSLLRILNLSNHSVKQEIDPIRNNLKQINFNANSSEQRNQKTRHVLSNNTYAKRIQPLRKQVYYKSLMNISRTDDEYLYPHERGHSRVYHGHEIPRDIYAPKKDANTNEDFRRYDYTTEPIDSYSGKDYRKYYNHYQQCTRNFENRYPVKNDCTSECPTNHCTRGIPQSCQQVTTCQPTFREVSFTNSFENHVFPHDLCPCTKQTPPTVTQNCNCNVNCRCLNVPCSTSTNCFTTSCPRIHRKQGEDFKDDIRKFGTYQNYDMLPNIVVRSNTEKPEEDHPIHRENPWFYDNTRINKPFKKTLRSEESDQIQKQVKVIDHSKDYYQDRDYLYSSFDSTTRNRRQLEDEITVKPFWQIDELNKPFQLKSLRYTTLANRRNRKHKKYMASPNLFSSTEPITIILTDTYVDRIDNEGHITERYLSFQELMHLRKNNGYRDYGARRKSGTTGKNTSKATTKAGATTKAHATTKAGATKKAGATTKAGAATKAGTTTKASATTKAGGTTKASATTKAAATTKGGAITTREKVKGTPTSTAQTSEMTANTPFERKKHCTRKLTCTWTAFTATGSDGNILLPGGGALDIGSRTPPGYVDGCTRTSTCTREYMDRNKMATLLDDTTGATNEPVPEDEDYCERRSLNVKKRYSNKRDATIYISLQHHFNTEPSTVIFNMNSDFNSINMDKIENTLAPPNSIYNFENSRKKRQGTDSYKVLPRKCCDDDLDRHFSYGDLHYIVLNKLINGANAKVKRTSCPCNSGVCVNIDHLCFTFFIGFTLKNVSKTIFKFIEQIKILQ